MTPLFWILLKKQRNQLITFTKKKYGVVWEVWHYKYSPATDYCIHQYELFKP
ncbi:MAG: hypothetical protein SFU21_17150 [Flavihumibacter sp.]|nr:hypothetical protein [Flavihumibacter sp.]